MSFIEECPKAYSECMYVVSCIQCASPSVVIGLFLQCVYIPSLVSEVLKKYEDEFFEVVNAKYNLLKLKRKGVITQDIERRISATNDDEAKEILYDHLNHHGSLETLEKYCKVAIAADGYPNMQSLAEKIMKELSQGGWLKYIYTFIVYKIPLELKGI